MPVKKVSPLILELEKAQEFEKNSYKKLELVYPKDISEEMKPKWDDFFRVLLKGVFNQIIDIEDLRNFEQRFYSVENQQKDAYVLDLDLKIEVKISNKEEQLQALKDIEIKEKIENAKTIVPDYLKPVIDFIAYSILMKQPLPEGLLKELELALSPEGQEIMIQQNIQNSIDQYRRNPLNAGEMAQGENFNKAYSREQVAQILDQAQGLPTQSQHPTQRIQPRSKVLATNQQRPQGAPKIEYVQTTRGGQRPIMQPQLRTNNTPPQNTSRKINTPMMRRAPTAQTSKLNNSGIDQTKSFLDQTAAVTNHNKGLNELLN